MILIFFFQEWSSRKQSDKMKDEMTLPKAVRLSARAWFLICPCGHKFRQMKDDGTHPPHVCVATHGDPSRTSLFGPLLAAHCRLPGPCAPETSKLDGAYEGSKTSRTRNNLWLNLDDAHALIRFYAVSGLTSVRQHSAEQVARRVAKFGITGRDRPCVVSGDGYTFESSANFGWCPFCRRYVGTSHFAYCYLIFIFSRVGHRDFPAHLSSHIHRFLWCGWCAKPIKSLAAQADHMGDHFQELVDTKVFDRVVAKFPDTLPDEWWVGKPRLFSPHWRHAIQEEAAGAGPHLVHASFWRGRTAITGIS